MHIKNIFAGIAILLIVSLPVLAGASSVRVGEQYVLVKEEVIEGNFYTAGANLVFAGEVGGDLVAAGGTITIEGSIAEDALLAGGTIILNGKIADDVRMVGGDLTISGTIGGDLVITGGAVRILAGAQVAGDILAAGGTVIVDGTVAGDIRIAGGDVMIIGSVDGSVWSHAERLTLSATAMVGGNLTNYAHAAAVLTPGATIKGSLVHEPTMPVGGWRSVVAEASAISFFMFLVAGLLCLWLFKNRSKQFVAHALAHFWKELLRGALLLIVIPIFVFSFLISVVGMPLGIIVLLVYIITILLAKVFAGIMLGGWMNKVVFKKPEQVFTWQTVIGGNVVLLLLGFIPVFGGIISFMFTLVAFGAFWGYMHRHFWKNR